jgi:response regulator of citrate/malate metabolism
MGYGGVNNSKLTHAGTRQDVYRFIVDYISKHTYAPSTHEIAEYLGISTATARRVVHELINEEILETDVDNCDLNRAYRIAGTKVVKKKQMEEKR